MDSLSDIKQKYKSGQITKPEYIEEMTSHHRRLFAYKQILSSGTINKIEITESGVVLCSGDSGVKMHCIEGDKRLAYMMALNFGAYEDLELKMLLSLMTESQTVFDVGANCGWFALEISAKYPEKQIHCFEPIRDIYRVLLQNIELNRFTNIHTYNFGFSDKEQEIELFFNQRDSAVTSMHNICETKESIGVKAAMTTMDKFCKENSVYPDLIKIDVEGAEYLVLQGGTQSLQKNLPIIFAELVRKWSKYFDYHPNEVIEFLAKLGYRCFSIHEVESKPCLQELKQMDDNTMETNFIFLHSEKHRSLILQQSR